MFKKKDYIIACAVTFSLGIFIVSQVFSTSEYKKVSTPENNEVMALEVARLTKTNADLRQEVKALTLDLDTYQSSSESKKSLYEQYQTDSSKMDIIIGASGQTGQGVEINIKGALSAAQVVDLVNAIKNIGSSLISINGQRITLKTPLITYANKENYQIDVLGNGKILKSALERKGGIIEQISSKDLEISVSEVDKVAIPSGDVLNFKYAKIINN
jgi:uncharacterized protein YlxW (UPF0749 family)